jgi:hypothetical protein
MQLRRQRLISRLLDELLAPDQQQGFRRLRHVLDHARAELGQPPALAGGYHLRRRLARVMGTTVSVAGRTMRSTNAARLSKAAIFSSM